MFDHCFKLCCITSCVCNSFKIYDLVNFQNSQMPFQGLPSYYHNKHILLVTHKDPLHVLSTIVSIYSFKCLRINNYPLLLTDVPMIPQGSLQHFISSQESCPNISVLIQIVEIQDIATLTYELDVSSSDGCVLEECPMLVSPGERILTVTLVNGVNYTATLEVSNDCGSNRTTVLIQQGM